MRKEYLVSAKEMKQLDNNTITKTGIPSLVLMERASLAVAECVMKHLEDRKNEKILVVAGNGNNGADGICAGRILTEYGYDVDICLLKSCRGYTEELQTQKRIADAYGITFWNEDVDFARYRVVVDAIYGVGLNRNIEGTAADIIAKINASDAYVISVDIPSGINASTGEVCGLAVKADETVTFGFYKCGQFFYPGRKYCKRVTKACIGIDETSFYDETPSMFTFMGSLKDTAKLERDVAGNKGTFGKVLVIAGRESTAGAALLCATSSLRSGCGMVAVFTQESNKEVFLANLPEAMVETYSEDTGEDILLSKLDKWLNWADVCVIGCGMSQDETAYRLLSRVISVFDKPVVADADALHLFAAKGELKELLYSRSNMEGKAGVIFTPHPGELAALAHCSMTEVKNNRLAVAKKVCKEYGVTLVAKDADSICMTDKEKVYLNNSGNNGMSTAGSGDVLVGLIGSLIAQAVRKNEELFEAVCLAVYIHGLAGDYQANRNGKTFLVASDIIEAYKYILE